ncbi:SDR family NAD(P)-dependent oxidoreductase [Amnibacterium flavum]|uniref:Short-chain dehydrogenase n=1 Tax=Amnibacterium flavum TaxID=2173173 RepID=A0A2V1HT35_9MICO|nr:SDR family oxidoreductase [Amnibacterium flavum]PVZ93244.1 hypothetical protein DDQ50_16180 [Amnibacterium flavum]
MSSERAWAPASGLPGRTIIITGAASGIGRVTAREASQAGMKVVLVDRDASGLEHAQDEIRQETAGEVSIVQADLAKVSDHERIIDEAQSATHLFHAAGVIVRRPSPSDVTEEDWDFQVNVNQKGSWFLTRAFCEALSRQGKTGSAVLVASVSANLGLISGSWVYASTKGGMVSMVKGFAKTYATAGIRVNALSPGIVQTPLVSGSVQNTEIDRIIDNNVPLGRTGRPEEIAQAGLFLLSDYASYVTGTNLDVDGGWLRR